MHLIMKRKGTSELKDFLSSKKFSWKKRKANTEKITSDHDEFTFFFKLDFLRASRNS